jgi:predicted metalloenzyme YecM
VTREEVVRCRLVEIPVPVIREYPRRGYSRWQHVRIAGPVDLSRGRIAVNFPSDPGLWRLGVQPVQDNDTDSPKKRLLMACKKGG